MPTETIFLVGGSGHASVVLDALLLTKPRAHVRVLDQNPALEGRTINGLSIEYSGELVEVGVHSFHVAVGNCVVREKIFRRLQVAGGKPMTIIHPAAVVAVAAQVGAGSFLAATCVIAPGVQLGDGCIVNHGATVDHGSIVGAFSHMGPNSSLAGDVRIGARTLVGVGSAVLPGVSIGTDSSVGAGAVVERDWDEPCILIGVPARTRNIDS